MLKWFRTRRVSRPSQSSLRVRLFVEPALEDRLVPCMGADCMMSAAPAVVTPLTPETPIAPPAAEAMEAAAVRRAQSAAASAVVPALVAPAVPEPAVPNAVVVVAPQARVAPPVWSDAAFVIPVDVAPQPFLTATKRLEF